MLFNLTRDEGHLLEAYVVPDAGSTTPSIVLRAGGKELMRLEANNTLHALVDAGRHTTGRCGFLVDESLAPDLATYADLEVVEASRDMLVYRRRPEKAIDMQVFRLETHLLPLWRVDDALRGTFQFWYKGIERFGRETAEQIFCIQNGGSLYASGRLLYRNYEMYLSRDSMKLVGIVRDPYLELAERLTVLKNLGSRADEILGERDVLLFSSTIESLQEWAVLDETFSSQFFRRAPAEVMAALSNPLVRQLTASVPDEMPRQGAMATALDTLASFTSLGIRSEGSVFTTALTDLMEVDPECMPPIREYPSVTKLGDMLRNNRFVEDILEKDLEVFQTVTNAFEM